jgi:Zn-finger nucleic acid-binding protein/membrane associated rhomboid family serine protease
MNKIFPNLVSVRQHKKMDCPDCQSAMTPYLCESAVIDKCDQCGGIWFDKNELSIFQQSVKKYDLTDLKVEEGLLDLSGRYQISECPRCKQALVEQAQGTFKKVHLQCCTKCRGQWVKSDQLIQLVDLLKINQAIEPDLKAVAKELSHLRLEAEKDQRLKQLGDHWGQPVASIRYDMLGSVTSSEPGSSWLTNRVVWILLGLNTVFSLVYWLRFSVFATSSKGWSCPRGLGWTDELYFTYYMLLNHNIFYYLVNSLALIFIGRIAERKMGSWFFGWMVLATAFVSSLIERFQICYNAAEPFLGLGGLVAGTIGAVAVYDANAKAEGLIGEYYVALSALLFAFAWIVIQFFFLSDTLWSFAWQIQVASFLVWAAAAGFDNK